MSKKSFMKAFLKNRLVIVVLTMLLLSSCNQDNLIV